MKKIAKMFLSFMLIVMCSFSLVACSGNDNDGKGNGNSSVDGVYYFNRETYAFYENDVLIEEKVNADSYGSSYGTSIKIENEQIEMDSVYWVYTLKLVKSGSNYELEYVDEPKLKDDYRPAVSVPDVNYSGEVSNYSLEEELPKMYLDVTDSGVIIKTIKEVDNQKEVYNLEYLKDSSKVVKHDYRLLEKDIHQSDNSVTMYPLGTTFNDFIDIEGDILTRYEKGVKYEYNATKEEGNVYTLTLLTEIEDASFETATLEMTENGFVISYSGEDIISATLTYIKI